MNDDRLLVEREGELAVLGGAVEGLSRGEGAGFVVVEGGAGLGKSRLLGEVKRLAEEAGMGVLSARGAELEREFGFGVVRQLFEPVLSGLEGAAREDVLSGAAAPAVFVLGAVTPGQVPVGDLGSLHSLYWLTGNLAQRGPLLLVVDDLHWADEASLRFLAYLVPRLDELEVLVVAGLRPEEPGAPAALLDRLVTDPTCVVLRLSALSGPGSSVVLREMLGGDGEAEFLAACAVATAGNPLLLRELAGALRMQGVAPVAGNAGMVADLGAEAVGRRIRLWLGRLPAESVALAHAVAVLGGEAPLDMAAGLADLSLNSALTAVGDLAAAELFRRVSLLDTEGRVGFVHPLVQATVYRTLPDPERVHAHRKAARALHDAGAEAERAAAHVLRLPAGSDAWVVQVLRRAGADALGRGAPEASMGYLRRCLDEQLDEQVRLEVLTELGAAAALVDLDAAASYLEQALGLAGDPCRKAEIAYRLGQAWFYLNRFQDVLDLYDHALIWASDADTDLQRNIHSAIIVVGWAFADPPRSDTDARLNDLRRLEPHPSVGGRTLDAIVAWYDALVLAAPAAIPRAKRAIADGLLVERGHSGAGLNAAWHTLLMADSGEAMASLDNAVIHAHQVGSTYALTAALTFRGLGWLWRGELTEAENDLRTAMYAAEAANVEIARSHIGPFLASTLIEQGRLQDAADVLDWVHAPDPLPRIGVWFWLLESRSSLLRAQGHYHQALKAAIEAGQHLEAITTRNPAVVPWRTEAALCLHAFGRTEEAREHAAEELQLARTWQAPRTLGRALRVTGLLTPGQPGLDLLHQAVTVLKASPARLERAKALAELGSRLLHSGSYDQARACLREAQEAAETLNATLLANRIRVDLRASGARPRTSAISGPRALTPSERRVVELAAAGQTNRDIAQNLFVSTKTVEVHLTNAYRKLGITKRTHLPQALAEG